MFVQEKQSLSAKAASRSGKQPNVSFCSVDIFNIREALFIQEWYTNWQEFGCHRICKSRAAEIND